MGAIKTTIIMIIIVLAVFLFTGILAKECETGETLPCDTGLSGPCETGKKYCEDGRWTPCIMTTEPAQEYCDGIDNDCDGTVDEDCWVCKPGDREQCGDTDKGACEYGLQTCRDDGQWGACVGAVEPVNEICFNNEDDDCDGQVDEGCGVCPPGEERQCGKTDKGVCEYGLQTCDADGQWGDCKGAVFPTVEKCGNNEDDDCDGEVDEGCAVCADGDTRQCGLSDVGRCEYGVETCTNGAWGSCVGAVYPTTETCNGKDDDCDGEVDEGCAVCMDGDARQCGQTDVGECEYGVETCVNGAWGSCVGAVYPTNETCNGLDDDCDGQVDEGCVTTYCGNGICDQFERTLTKGAPAESFDLYGGSHSIRAVNVTSTTTAIIEIDGTQKTLTRGVEDTIAGLEVLMDQLQYNPAPWDWANVIVGETADNCPQDC